MHAIAIAKARKKGNVPKGVAWTLDLGDDTEKDPMRLYQGAELKVQNKTRIGPGAGAGACCYC